MGPRSGERGENAWDAETDHALRSLQWGRARVSAESTLAGNLTVQQSVLQWGRARVSAERTRRRSAVRAQASFNGAALG